MKRAIERWRADYGRMPVRWLAPIDYHITISPPWHEDDIKEAAKRLRIAAGAFAPFGLRFREVALGPGVSYARLVWAVAEPSLIFSYLARRVRRTMMLHAPAGREIETPHITIARFRPGGIPKEWRAKFPAPVAWDMSAAALVLFESSGRPEERYRVLERAGFGEQQTPPLACPVVLL